MRKLNNVSTAFTAGFIFAGALYCLFQDIMGLEGYIVFARAHWVSGWATVPLSITLLIISLAVLAVCLWHEKEIIGYIKVLLVSKPYSEHRL